MKPVLALLLLLALPLAASAAQAADAGEAGACVHYAYVADYQWHHLCVEPEDASCPVYTRVHNGASWGPKECLAELPAVGTDALAPRCVPVAHDLEHSYYACVDARDASCPVYLLRKSGGTEEKTCVGHVA